MKISKQIKWDYFFLDVAWNAAKMSPDPSTQVGAVLVKIDDNQLVSVGYNGFPRGVEETPERWERPTKYDFVVHAERNCILNAAREGRSTLNTRLYLYYDACPCIQCTLDIIQAGVKEVALGGIPFHGHGNGHHYDTSIVPPIMYKEAGIKIRDILGWVPPGTLSATYPASIPTSKCDLPPPEDGHEWKLGTDHQWRQWRLF